MYTWGYIKENTLAKLNISEEVANQLGFLSRFSYFANEAMTQMCSIHPNELFAEFIVGDNELNTPFTMPEMFIAFSDDVVCHRVNAYSDWGEVGDEFVEYIGHNRVTFKYCGIYRVPYKARWFFFTKDLPNDTDIPAPADLCDALPSYIASQCYKIDDEVKSAIYRNEYEMFLARIDDTSFKSQRTFHIGGGW